MSNSSVRTGWLVIVAAGLAACAGGPTTSNRTSTVSAPSPAAASPSALGVAPVTSPSVAPTGTPSSAPSIAAVVLPPPPVAAPAVAPAPPAPPMAHSSTQMFSLVAVGDARARGAVTVTVESGRAQVSVVATGLPSGSVHSVHLHFGNCPSAGSHILVLGTLRADASGSGSVSVNVNPAFVGPGHFVIIYLGPTAGPLGACANLG